MTETSPLLSELQGAFGQDSIIPLETRDAVTTALVTPDKLKAILRHLKTGIEQPFEMLYDLTAIDERSRARNPDPRFSRPDSDFTVVYHLMSFGRNEEIRLKVPLRGEHPSAESIVDIWPSANWYEREAW